MKVGFAACIAVVIGLLVAVVWSAGRISELEDEVAALEKEKQQSVRGAAPSGPRPSARSNSPGPKGPARSVAKSNRPPSEKENAEEESDDRMAAVGEFFRELMELEGMEEPEPEEGQEDAEKMFSTFMDELNLSDAARAQFLEIVGPGMAAEDQLWEGIIMAKTDAEKQEVLKQWQDANSQREGQLKEFLDSNDDYARYQQYEARREEYEQIEGLREALADVEAPLTTEQEGQLVEALFNAREQSGMNNRWEGAAVIDQLSKPGLVDRMKQDWNQLQTSADNQVSTILTDQQREVFNKQQERTLRELSVGLRFVEAMIGNSGKEGGEE